MGARGGDLEGLARLGFGRPVADRADLAWLLHPVLCPRRVHAPVA